MILGGMILFGIGGLLVAFGVFGSFKYWTLRLGLIGFGLGWIMPFQYGYITFDTVGFNIGSGLAFGISFALIGLVIDLARRFRLENFRPNQVKHPEHKQQTQYTAPAVEEEKAFDLAATEVDKGNIRNGLWTKLLVDNNGDENITRLHYIRLRAAEILKEIEKERTKSDEQHWSDDDEDLALPSHSSEVNENLAPILNNGETDKDDQLDPITPIDKDNLLMLAKQGNVSAQYNLGVMHTLGQGVAQNYTEAVRWTRLAAEQGDVDAQYNLGQMYRKGTGVAQDHAQAYVWFNVSAAQGNEQSSEVLELSGQLLPHSLLNKAQQQSQRCIDSGYQDCDL